MVKKNFYSEEDYIKAIRNDDNLGLTALYKLHFPLILNFILTNNGSEEEAKDIFQEAIIVLITNLKDETFRLECKIKTYIYSVSRRLWLSELREKRNYSGNINDIENYIHFEEKLIETIKENEKRYGVMETSLLQLGEPCGMILKDYYLNKNSMNDIAEKMGYTNTANAKNQKYKCLQRLKKIFFLLYDK